MSDHISKTIADVQGRIETLEAELRERKRMVNSLCTLDGRPEVYSAVDLKMAPSGTIRSDQFYGKPLASVVREILEMRRQALMVNEIYSSMLAGGFQFDSKSEDNAKRILRISLAKNSVTFHKVPNGAYGLLEWYPAAKPSSKTPNGKVVAAEDDDEHPSKDDLGEASEDDAERLVAAKSVKG